MIIKTGFITIDQERQRRS